MRLPDVVPPARGSSVGDHPDAAQLGFDLFFDARLSSTGEVRCATCHLPERTFQDGVPTSTGVDAVHRNSPTLLNAAWYRWQFWDGRADTLWSQPLFALEEPREMDFTRLELAHRIRASYRTPYEALFGPLPPLEDGARFPPRGRPGDAAWESMTAADRDAVNQVAANVGKALEAYERKLAAGPGAFERYLDGDAEALTQEERRGVVAFMKAGCQSCHLGPGLSDERFYALFPPLNGVEDRGRAEGLEALGHSPFNAQGRFFEGPAEEAPAPAAPQDVGAFRTPSLRNVALTAPYGHDGRFATLEALLEAHAEHAPRPPAAEDRAHLLAFLRALNGRYPAPPWNNWPDR